MADTTAKMAVAGQPIVPQDAATTKTEKIEHLEETDEGGGDAIRGSAGANDGMRVVDVHVRLVGSDEVHALMKSVWPVGRLTLLFGRTSRNSMAGSNNSNVRVTSRPRVYFAPSLLLYIYTPRAP